MNTKKTNLIRFLLILSLGNGSSGTGFVDESDGDVSPWTTTLFEAWSPTTTNVATRTSSDVVTTTNDDVTERNLLESNANDNVNGSTNRTISSYFLWESSLWSQRSFKTDILVNITAFDQALREVPQQNCELGVTATLFDQNAQQVYQETVGSRYNTLQKANGEESSPSPFVNGWTADTTFALYSNSKIFAAVLFMAAVVDTGLGSLDEPLWRIFPEHLTSQHRVGKVTPRLILSHRSGIRSYNRNDNTQDPFYQCIYNTTTTWDSCIQDVLLQDDALLEEPGTVVRYNNEPFNILGLVIVRKQIESAAATAGGGGADYNSTITLEQVLQDYITNPLNMTATSYDCPLVKSTSSKPHVSWGICSTGRDVPKLIQVLANHGKTVVGDDSSSSSSSSSSQQILSADSVYEILSFQGGIADYADIPLRFANPLNNCIGRWNADFDNSLIGYGLGTMISAGVKGKVFLHAGTVGGLWVVAPNRYAAYLAFMKEGAFPAAYVWMARVIYLMEMASTFRVSNVWEDEWNEILPCTNDMFLTTDLLDQATMTPAACPETTSPTTTTTPTMPPSALSGNNNTLTLQPSALSSMDINGNTTGTTSAAPSLVLSIGPSSPTSDEAESTKSPRTYPTSTPSFRDDASITSVPTTAVSRGTQKLAGWNRDAFSPLFVLLGLLAML